jgi:type II secretory pathway component PulJ
MIIFKKLIALMILSIIAFIIWRLVKSNFE